MPKKAKKAAKERPIPGKPKGKHNGKPKKNASSDRNSRTETFRGKKLKNIMTGERRGNLANDLRFHPVEFVRADEFTLSMEKTSAAPEVARQALPKTESSGSDDDQTNADIADGIVDSIIDGVSESDIDDEVADSVADGIVDSITEARISDAEVEDEIVDSVADSIADNIADVEIDDAVGSVDADSIVDSNADADIDEDIDDIDGSDNIGGVSDAIDSESDTIEGASASIEGASVNIEGASVNIENVSVKTGASGNVDAAIGNISGASMDVKSNTVDVEGTSDGTSDESAVASNNIDGMSDINGANGNINVISDIGGTTDRIDANSIQIDSNDVHSNNGVSVAAGSTDQLGGIEMVEDDIDVDHQGAEPMQPELNGQHEDLLLGSESDGELDDFIRQQAIQTNLQSLSDSDSSNYTPKITLDDYEDYSDVNMSDNMSELDDDQIFALASGSSVFQHEDRDVFDKYDEYDEYFDELIGGGGKQPVSDRKKLKRQAREAMHAVQFGKTPALWREYPDFISVHEVLDELRKFAMQKNVQQLAFPPLDNNANWYVSSLATQHGMTAVTEGKMDAKYIRVSRTNRTTAHVPDQKLRKFLTRRKTFARTDVQEMKKVRSKVVKGEKVPSARVRDGHIVGHDATEIGDSNFGHKLLRQMGWQEGSGLGKERAGIVAPIPATVKLSKVGLGG